MEQKGALQKNKLIVPFLPVIADRDIETVTHVLQGIQKHRLTNAPWVESYPSKPMVQFAIAYSGNSICLQYDVEEDFIQAAKGKVNDPVYQDSCVEFFFSLDEGETYYNFEFNCIGTVLGAYGTTQHNRQFLPENLLKQVECQGTIRRRSRQPFVSWQLTVILPCTLFNLQSTASFREESCCANFYKCGDHLPEPHFLCWSPVQSVIPNFHLPQYFGTLAFGLGDEIR